MDLVASSGISIVFRILGLDYSDLNLLEGFNSLKQMGSDRFVLSLSFWGIKHLSYFVNKCPNNGF